MSDREEEEEGEEEEEEEEEDVEMADHQPPGGTAALGGGGGGAADNSNAAEDAALGAEGTAATATASDSRGGGPSASAASSGGNNKGEDGGAEVATLGGTEDGAAAAPSNASGGPPPRKKKPSLKKRSRADETTTTTTGGASGGGASSAGGSRAAKKRKPQRRGGGAAAGAEDRSGKSSSAAAGANPNHQAVRDMMRRALEEDQYSAYGSIVDTDSDSDDGGGDAGAGGGSGSAVEYKGSMIRLDRTAIHQYATQYAAALAAKSSSLWGGSNGIRGTNAKASASAQGLTGAAAAPLAAKEGTKDGSSRGTAGTNARSTVAPTAASSGGGIGGPAPAVAAPVATATSSVVDAMTKELEEEWDLDGGSIFGQTTGSSNFTWVECDKCKKWRRLRGVVDEKKLPSRWYCSMNKNDPERNRCSAPEEEYDASHSTPESAADARCRKHLRVWVRRLQCNETYEARQPTQTRGKKKAQSSSKEPYEWIRCCNPSCGKWRSLLRIMEAKSVIEKTQDGEWYCVMNTWDEKVASCAAPQENLPAIGCPPWVLQDDADA